jgi:LytS/YehU family sensor histidine kinase
VIAGAFDAVLWVPAAALAVLCALLTGIHYALRTRDLEAALRDERLTVLSMELRPHFLLNALNTAAELVHRDSNAADQLLTAVGQLLSHSLRDGRRHLVPLARELELLQHYHDVERARFADRLTLELAVDSDALAVSVPPFILQLLVENSVRHGIAPGAHRVTVRIVAMRDAAMLRLDVIDDGVGFGRVSKESRGSGVGIANVRARLHEIHGTRQSVEITSHVGRGTTVAIRLPWQRCEGA